MSIPSPRIAGTISCDVVILGAGGAGLRCAAKILESRPEAEILALTKVVHAQKSHTSAAQGGLAAVDPSDPEDRIAFHMFDTWKGSDCMADQNVIQRICRSSWEEILWLENRGMHFTRDQDGRLSKRTFGGHTLRFGQGSAYRAVFEADRTGKGIMDTVWSESLKRKVTFMAQTMATELIIRNGRCLGCVALDQTRGELLVFLAGAVVLATGGSGQLFKVTTNCRQNTGDGLALALAAGLPVMDPEAVQFHPTGIVGPGILASEAIRGEGGILRNAREEPFMEGYAPRMKDLAPRDLVSRAIETEIRQGRGIRCPDHGIEHVWIDLRHLSDYAHEVKLREISGFFKKFANLDPRRQLCPVRPSNHYHMGGVPTDDLGRVQDARLRPVAGLYAVGECAAASFHGFNRLATNSLLELITMGRLVGRTVLEELEGRPSEPPPGAGDPSRRILAGYLAATGSESPGRIREELRSLMTGKVGIFRTEESLEQALEAIAELKDRAGRAALTTTGLVFNQELIQRLELDNLLNLALVVARAALERRESRGAHYREDYPERLAAYDHHTLAGLTQEGRVELGRRPVEMSLLAAGGEDGRHFDYLQRTY